ncbi:glycosyltransferase family 2 protein [Achromobacter aloeverae]|uniref:Glycosyl transferase family 2 n=1 Tax=Achromobacter aloeverae TaxID=1750518 RepID=A0A4V1MRT5_9BURK|nr:glycosyltransferase [Achromobacter aloeverae]RXN86171.1 glycosyl transferase family 2 [Achromobacter aloeverae]
MRQATPPSSPVVAVVVPTYRRADLLDRCLGALCAQTLPSSQYEIIVCDDGPDEVMRETVLRHARRPGAPALAYLPVTATQGPAGARNAGWRATQAPIIAFTDDDTVPRPDWLAAGLAAMRPGVDAVAGAIVMPIPPNPSDYELDASHLQEAEFATANCLVRRAALDAVGGFDTRYGMAWREDSDLQFALLEGGYDIERAPAAIVEHPLRPAPYAVALRAQRKVRYDTLLYKKYPRLYRERIRRGPPWHYLSICALLAVVVLALAAGQRGLAVAAGLGWLVLTARFFLRRIRPTRKDLPHLVETLITSIAIPPLSIYWRIVGSLAYRAGFP